MVHCCCVYGCTNKFLKGAPFTLHCFPKNEFRKKLWEGKVRPGGFKVTNSSRICSEHFTADSFDRNKTGGSWLTKDAVPTIFNFNKIQGEQPKTRKVQSVGLQTILAPAIPVHFTEDQFENHRADNRRLLKQTAVPSVFSHRPPLKSRRHSKYVLQKDSADDIPKGNDPDVNSSNSANKEDSVRSHSDDRLKQQQEEPTSSNPTDDSPAGPSNIKPPYVMKESKLFVSVPFFVKSLQNLNNHGGDGCNFSDMYISGETNNDWNVGIELSCTMCLTTVVVWMQDPGPDLKKQPPSKPPTSAGANAKKTPSVTAEKVFSASEEPLKEHEKIKTKKFTNKKFISEVPAKERRVSKRKTPAPPPDPTVQQHFMLPPSPDRPIHVPQSNSFNQEWTGNPSYSISKQSMVPQRSSHCQDSTGSLSSFNTHIMVPQPHSVHQNLMDNPSNSSNSLFINQVPFIKQEIGALEDAANPFLTRVPLSSTQPVSVQLLFSVENSNDMPLSSDENVTSTPGEALRNHQTSSIIGLNSGQTMVTSENETIVPEVGPSEVLPVDLNFVKTEVEDESQSVEVNNIPSVRIVPMSETSINRSETAFASESFTETSKDSTLGPTRSGRASTNTYATDGGTKLSVTVSDTLGAKTSTVSSYPTSSIPQTVFQHVIPRSREDVSRQTANGRPWDNKVFTLDMPK